MSHSVKITVLCDNHVDEPYLLAEHGFSLFIETETVNILFDTGQGMAIEQNTGSLGIDLQSVNMVVLSHGHYDHTGGLVSMSKGQGRINICAHPDVLQAKYRRLKTGIMKYIGYPQSLLKENKLKFTLNREPSWITSKILLTGEIPRRIPFEVIEEPFYAKLGNRWVKDRLLDDQALVIDLSSGLVVILGCTHSGFISTLTRARELTGKNHFHAILGGIHLMNAGRKKVTQTVAALESFDIKNLILCHCTGIMAFMKLHQAFGDRVSLGQVGTVWQMSE